ncbi:hypothetical protein [Nocardia sp. CNY236]|uniref:hypothetical protein n=1 Tax=Nocardia sp. CNY236 TaxID=1169152 RepID=UPI0003FCC019|nr:hypothetical protein [Nocardia sp. CNY236]
MLSAIACATSAFVLGQAQTLSTNGVDTLQWVVLTWLLLRWVRTCNDALLLTAGLVTAVAVQVKWLVPGVLDRGDRRRWMAGAKGVAAASRRCGGAGALCCWRRHRG